MCVNKPPTSPATNPSPPGWSHTWVANWQSRVHVTGQVERG